MLTAETLPRHELVGLHVRVADSSDPTLVGCEGEVVSETTNTLVLESVARTSGQRQGSRSVRVPKAVATFEFRLDDVERRSTTDDSDAEYVVVDGERLVARPARRTERTGDSRWQ
ncbi:ribonuclease P protein component 1 [Halomarina oriensis]|uniref:Ribonuclease P protein component 1 n=1 Tax=Halomarina oriensis TaxID=671145 RepID=A0A6B0GNH2_9EURY|nr:ribonuclease P protein component 1 [Halomarina oriensis]MWG35137.1 ribonuclease P [Halomarina oriensis]